MIEMHISYTSRTPHPSSKWTLCQDVEKRFEDMDAALEFLGDAYFYCKKRIPCYHDTKSRGTVQCGWIYCFKEKENGKTYYCQHWVSFAEVDYKVIDVRQHKAA